MEGITRRLAIGRLTAFSASLAYAREKGDAFGLVGDRYHNSDYIRTALGPKLSSETPGYQLTSSTTSNFSIQMDSKVINY